MSVTTVCRPCHSSFKVGTRHCPRCGQALKGPFKVRVAGAGKTLSKTCPTLKTARRVEASFKARVIDEDCLGIQPPAPTVGEAADSFLKWSRLHKRSWKGDVGRWTLYLNEDLQHIKLDRLTAAQITATLDRRITLIGLKPATRHRALALLRRVINHAIEGGTFSGPNPCSRVRHIPYDNTMNDWLTADEVKRLLDALDADVNQRAALALRFMVFSGRRKSEVLSLRWSDLSANRSTMTVTATNSKNKKVMTYPLNEPARKIIRQVEVDRISELVFCNTVGKYMHDIYKPWKRIKKRAGINTRIHGLRHTAGAAMVQAGVPLYTVSKVLGHSNIKTTERYAHLSPGVVQGAVDRLGEVLGLGRQPETPKAI